MGVQELMDGRVSSDLFFFFFLSDHLFQTMCICLEVPIFFQQQVDFFLSAHFFQQQEKSKLGFEVVLCFMDLERGFNMILPYSPYLDIPSGNLT